jgi:chromosome segregation ATPase
MSSKLDLILTEVRDLKDRFDRQEGKLDVTIERLDQTIIRLDRTEERQSRTEDRQDRAEDRQDRAEERLNRIEAKEDARFGWTKDQFVAVRSDIAKMATKTEMAEGFAGVHRELTVIRNHTAHMTERVVAIEEFHRKNCL